MASSLRVGDKVILNGEEDWYGHHLCSWTKGMTFDVQQVGAESRGEDYIVIGVKGEVTAAVHEADLELVNKPKKQNSSNTPAAQAGYKVNANALVTNAVNNALSSVNRKNAVNKAAPIKTNSSKVVETDFRMDAKKTNDGEGQSATMELNAWKNAILGEVKDIENQSQQYVQTSLTHDFPKVLSGQTNYKRQLYSYEQKYDSDDVKINSADKSVLYDMTAVRRSLNLLNRSVSPSTLRQLYMNNYNRFKETYVDDMLNKTFAHVFFVRPNCNIFDSGSALTLTETLTNIPEFYYALKHNKLILQQLQQDYGGAPAHQFMFYPSNKVRSFEVADEYIVTDTYGQSRTGYKVPYGKHNVESRTADKFSCTYVDDNRLTVYHVHKLWMDYVSYIYRGKITPRPEYIKNKIIDYATCVYYILCAEDGETIIFWSKYTGVFPIKAPSSSFSFTAENPGGIAKPEINIEYQYAWKEDFNPLSLVEFNEHTGNHTYQYTNSYQASKLGPASTWSGCPFIETFTGVGNGNNFIFKLRFNNDSNSGEYKNSNNIIPSASYTNTKTLVDKVKSTIQKLKG